MIQFILNNSKITFLAQRWTIDSSTQKGFLSWVLKGCHPFRLKKRVFWNRRRSQIKAFDIFSALPSVDFPGGFASPPWSRSSHLHKSLRHLKIEGSEECRVSDSSWGNFQILKNRAKLKNCWSSPFSSNYNIPKLTSQFT